MRVTDPALGSASKACLNPAELDGKAVRIPANTTRIDKGGFALCPAAADIVYVMDQSGSMNVSYAWVSPDKADTVYLQSIQDCGFTTADATEYGQITIPYEAGTKSIPVLNPNKSIAACVNTSGDPFSQRALAFRQTLEYQASRSPFSTAGYMGFAGTVVDAVRPLRLDAPGNLAQLKSMLTLRYLNNTVYDAPLDSAKSWLLDTALSVNPFRAVIFLTDGRPTLPARNGLAVIESTYASRPGRMPPIYGVFLGSAGADTLILDSLSGLTGGRFFRVPPARPDSLKAVLAGIVDSLLGRRPVRAVLSDGPDSAFAGPGAFTERSDKAWSFDLNKEIPLSAQKEQPMRLAIRYSDPAAEAVGTEAGFILATTDPVDSTNRFLEGTPFTLVCWDPSSATAPAERSGKGGLLRASYSQGWIRIEGLTEASRVEAMDTRGSRIAGGSARQGRFDFAAPRRGIYLIRAVGKGASEALKLAVP